MRHGLKAVYFDGRIWAIGGRNLSTLNVVEILISNQIHGEQKLHFPLLEIGLLFGQLRIESILQVEER